MEDVKYHNTNIENIVDYLGNSSGSDDEMSIEAKRVTRRKKLEREKLQKLGLFITSYKNSENFRRSRDKSLKESLFRWIQKLKPR